MAQSSKGENDFCAALVEIVRDYLTAAPGRDMVKAQKVVSSEHDA
jgi:hypothetical protein